MSLSLYNKKRDFKATPEPAGKEKSSKEVLRFVVQKHDASSLHYDFRLEMMGVLKSWAVPKGPSLNPADKRLAMMVEDHPYDYRTFEGVIPEGNYGGGTVIVWDEGTYTLPSAASMSKAEMEKALLHALEKGSLKIELDGKKLKGSFTLFQVKRDASGKSWLLVKKGDDYATDEAITLQNKSVLSGKTIAQVAADNGVTPNHPEEESTPKKEAKKAPAKKAQKTTVVAPAKKTKATKSIAPELLGDSLKLAKKSALPEPLKPMLATLVDAPFDSKDWLYEIKWDGYRAIAYTNNGDVSLLSRNKKPFTDRYTPVTEALQNLGINAVLDGEVVALNEDGVAGFQLLQNWQNNPAVSLQYYVFDIIWLDGYDLTALPLVQRKNILKKILPAKHAVLKYSDHVMSKGTAFFEAALQQGLEGIMAKRADSIYQTGNRTEDWVKIKVAKRQEVVIAGYTQPRNSRKYFGALLLGVYKGNELIYIGHTGSGFNKKSLGQIYDKLQPLVTDVCPFVKCPKGNMPTTWVKPKLVCEIKFTEWTKELIARHPIFMGLRVDKKPKEVSVENSTTMSAIINKTTTQKEATPAKKSAAKKMAAPKKSTAKQVVTEPVALSQDVDQEVIVDKQELKLTNLNKPYWKKEGFTKGDMLQYYLQIAPFMMPYLLNRPQSLNRHPNGVGAPNFFQKDMKGKLPPWMQTHTDFSESTNVNVEYLVCTNAAVLAYMANLGCIEINPWHSRVSSVLQPDWCLIDLDPDKKNTFEQVIQTAQVVKKVLDATGAHGCVKTSGATGIHIYIPMGAKYSYDQSKQLAQLLVTLVQQELPELTSIERNPEKRKGKIYLDFLQNRETQTAAAPYSLRPKPGVPVSTPLHWDELKKGLTPVTYHARNIFERLKTEGDLFKPVLEKGIDLHEVLKKMQSLV